MFGTYRFVFEFLVSMPNAIPLLTVSDSTGTLLGPAIAAIVTFPGIWLTYRQASNARKSADQIESRRVDAEAYDRAQKLMERGIEQLEDQVSRLKSELAERDQEVLTLRKRVRELEDQMDAFRRTMGE